MPAVKERNVKKESLLSQRLAELEKIRKKSKDGILYPENVVEYAEKPDTALHNYFEWDDTKAGHAYRIWQARQLIKVMVTLIPNKNEPICAYVSLTTDRYSLEGGYRYIVDVMSDKEMRAQFFRDALDDFNRWQQKYREIEELIPIFRAAERVKKKLKI